MVFFFYRRVNAIDDTSLKYILQPGHQRNVVTKSKVQKLNGKVQFTVEIVYQCVVRISMCSALHVSRLKRFQTLPRTIHIQYIPGKLL